LSLPERAVLTEIAASEDAAQAGRVVYQTAGRGRWKQYIGKEWKEETRINRKKLTKKEICERWN
jgi:hypothetical protein